MDPRLQRAIASYVDQGYELDLLYLACLAALVLGGPGPLAIDRYLSTKWNSHS